MSQTNRCPECGAELPTRETEGLCPKCLMRAGLEGQSKNKALSATTPASGSFVPPEPAELAPYFPQLEILELLGHGGMGAVYKAMQTKLDRPVALKIIKPESAADPAFAERFNREAKTLARLNHPHIVGVHDFGEAGELFFFIMEYVDGANLRQLIEGEQLEPEQGLAVVPQICEALQFAHDEGIVHRDIKPENILLDRKGRVKIADFGLAKLAGGSPQDFTLTGTNQVMGTPRYMAPEQMVGSHQVDHRADIYSLGVVFYEMLTGDLPIGRFDPPSHKADVDAELDKVVLRTLEREPDRRYQQVSELGTDVEAVKLSASLGAGAAEPMPGVRGEQTRRWPLVTIGLCVLVLLMTMAHVQDFLDRARLRTGVRFGAVQVKLDVDTEDHGLIGPWNSRFTFSYRKVTVVIPNWFLLVVTLAIGGCAVLRAMTGRTWPLVAQSLLAVYGCAHTIVFLVLMAHGRMNIQFVPLLMAVSFGVLFIGPSLRGASYGIRWSVRKVRALPHPGRCIDEALEVYKKNFAVLVAAGFLSTLLSLLSLTVLMGPLMGGWSLMAINAIRREDNHVELGDLFRAFRKFSSLCGLFYVTLIPMVAGFWAFLVPGLLLMTCWFFCFFLIVDRDERVSSSFGASFRMVKASGFGKYFLLAMIITAISIPAAIPYAGLIIGPFVTPLSWLVAASAYLQEVDEKKPPKPKVRF